MSLEVSLDSEARAHGFTCSVEIAPVVRCSIAPANFGCDHLVCFFMDMF